MAANASAWRRLQLQRRLFDLQVVQERVEVPDVSQLGSRCVSNAFGAQCLQCLLTDLPTRALASTSQLVMSVSSITLFDHVGQQTTAEVDKSESCWALVLVTSILMVPLKFSAQLLDPRLRW